jgi:hypothetical protein
MIFWSLCAFIWFRNMKKMLLQMTSVSLQPVPSLVVLKHEFYKTYIKTRVRFAARLLQAGVPINDERS